MYDITVHCGMCPFFQMGRGRYVALWPAFLRGIGGSDACTSGPSKSKRGGGGRYPAKEFVSYANSHIIFSPYSCVLGALCTVVVCNMFYFCLLILYLCYTVHKHS